MLRWGTRVLTAVLIGCGGAPDRDVVARIGDHPIRASHLEAQGQRLLRGVFRDVEAIDDEVRRRLLGVVIDKELLVLEAERRGLGSVLTAGLQQYEAQLVRRELFTHHVFRPVMITEGGLDSLGRAEGWDREVRFRHIMLTSVAAARAALDGLRRGEDFAEIAAAISTHRPTAPRGGDMGWVPMPQMLPAATDALAGLEPGQVQMSPVETPFGVHVFQLLGRRQVDPTTHRVALEALYEVRQHQAQVESYLDSLSAAHDLQCADRVDNDLPCAWMGGQMSRADLDAYLRYELRNEPTPAMRQTHRLGAARRHLATLEALSMRLHQTPAMRERIEQRRAQFMAAHIEADVTGEVRISDAQIQAYYDAHPAEYGDKPTARIREVFLTDPDSADAVRRRLEAGEDALALAVRYSERHSTRDRQGRIDIILRDNPSLGVLAPLALDGEVGEIYGPVEVPGGYSVFVIEAKPVRPARSLQSARSSLAAILRARAGNQIMDALLDSLREASADRVTIYDEVLATVLTERRPVHEPARRSVWEN